MPAAKRVLIVDDEPQILDLFSTALRQYNHQVDVAENGRSGFRKATTRDYDLIIFDLHLPEWNGYDAIKGIQLIKPDSRFLVVSGFVMENIAEELLAMPEVTAVLSKPVDLRELVALVEAV